MGEATAGGPVAASGSKWMVWVGWVMTALPAGLVAMGGTMSVLQAEASVEGLATYGFPEGIAPAIGVAALVSVVLYLVPQTAVLGAILLTGYLGGATVTHVRVEEAFVVPVITGVLVWGGLFLRDGRIRALIPLRKT